MNQWRPIKTAPKDGRKVLVYSTQHGKDIIRASWVENVGWVNSSGFRLLWKPEYWLPIDAMTPVVLESTA